MSDDATVMSALTMDSSFPKDIRKHYSNEKVREKKDTQKENLDQLNNVSHKIAHIKLACRIKELQEKVRLAKMIEEVYEQSLCDSGDEKSYCAEEEEEEEEGSRQSSCAGRSRARRSNKGDAESDCWSQETSTTVASFDPDFFKQTNEAPPIFEEDVEDSVQSGASSRSRRSTKSKSSAQSRGSTASRRSRGSAARSPRRSAPRKVATVPSLEESEVSTFSDDEDEETLDGLLEGFPSR